MHVDGAALTSNAPSYTIELLSNGEVSSDPDSGPCPSDDDFWLHQNNINQKFDLKQIINVKKIFKLTQCKII